MDMRQTAQAMARKGGGIPAADESSPTIGTDKSGGPKAEPSADSSLRRIASDLRTYADQIESQVQREVYESPLPNIMMGEAAALLGDSYCVARVTFKDKQQRKKAVGALLNTDHDFEFNRDGSITLSSSSQLALLQNQGIPYRELG